MIVGMLRESFLMSCCASVIELRFRDVIMTLCWGINSKYAARCVDKDFGQYFTVAAGEEA